ncbi:MAG: hypothetical protein WKF72_08685 [Nocardioidaceae bacterium]
MARARHPDERSSTLSGLRHSLPEVDVVAEQRQSAIQATEPVPDVTAYEHSRRADSENVTLLVLALVVLTGLEAGLT